MTLKKEAFAKIVEKGKNADYDHFLHFHKSFLPHQQERMILAKIMTYANTFRLVHLKLGRLVQSLNQDFFSSPFLNRDTLIIPKTDENFIFKVQNY